LKKIPETEDADAAMISAPGDGPERAEHSTPVDVPEDSAKARHDATSAGDTTAEPPATPHTPARELAAAASPKIATMPTRPPGGVPGRVMPPPRPMAKAEQFAEGDHVVYPTHGVGKVERIATEEIAGHKLELIHITFEENRMTLRVPVTKARTAGLRKLATRKMFDEAMTVLRGRPRIKRTMWSRRAQEYEAKINSGDPLAIAEVVRDLHRNSGQPDQSFSERQIYEAAMDRLAAELAALERIDKATASTQLVEFLKTV
jgi:CarD family transcriptional regulator